MLSQSFTDRLLAEPRKQLIARSPALTAYRQAAAVVSSFDPLTLVPFQEKASEEALTQLLAECTIAQNLGGGHYRWGLRIPMRHLALKELVEAGQLREALQARASDSDDDGAEILAQCDKGLYFPLEGRELETLNAMLEVSRWVEDIPLLAEYLPPSPLIRQAIQQKLLLEPFRKLAGAHFAGRRLELARISDYVEVLEASSFGASLHRGARNLLGMDRRPPLLLHGPGGFGKSTLVARFILDNNTPSAGGRFPFVYLDFDRSGLAPERPATLLFEIVRQLVIQYPAFAGRLQQIVESAEQPGSSPQVFAAETSEAAPLEATPSEPRISDDLLSNFTMLLDDIKSPDQPFLLVLDTFEEVQFRSRVYEREVFAFLEQLQARIPRLRVVISGRAEVETAKVDTLKIGPFDQEAALAFLAYHDIRPDLAQALFDQVGGSPLVLKLAAELARVEGSGPNGLENLRTGGFFKKLRRESIAIVLYQRILAHVQDQRLTALAYPGLVLRVITAELILQVLGPVCEVEIQGIEDAEAILYIMREQLSTLLLPDGDSTTLVHRPDMRAILLDDVEAKSATDSILRHRLLRLHEAAIAFYAARKGLNNRAEEIYHRLSLGIDRQALTVRWVEGLKPFLGASIQELPLPSQAYLAARLALELPAETWAAAEDADWTLYALRVAEEMIQLGNPDQAINFLRQRPALAFFPSVTQAIRTARIAMLNKFARKYEHIRATQPSGIQRTSTMTNLTGDIGYFARVQPTSAEDLHSLFHLDGTSGARLVALVSAEANAYPDTLDLAIEAIESALSPFEQFHALRLAQRLLKENMGDKRLLLREALRHQTGVRIDEDDPSRADLRERLLEELDDKDELDAF